MGFLIFLKYIVPALVCFKIIDILVKRIKNTNKKSKIYTYYFLQLILGIIGCYLFYKAGMWAAEGWGKN